MLKVYREDKGNLKFEIASDGKTAHFVVPDQSAVEIPTEVIAVILFHYKLAVPDMRCLLDGKEPENPFQRLTELEEIAKAQEEGLEELRTQSDTLNERLQTQDATIEEQKVRIEELTAELEVANIAATAARAAEVPKHDEAPEPS